MLDVGCGIGHSHEALAPRISVGLDIDPEALRGHSRETRLGDMRALPFADDDFDAVISVQAIEHVPDPGRALAEARRVVRPDGVAVFVTPNRVTFSPSGEIVDPYHHVEFSAAELRSACEAVFGRVELYGLFGSARYLELVAAERRALDRFLRLDPLRVRRLVPRAIKKRLYDLGLRHARPASDHSAAVIGLADFTLREAPLDEALDLIAVCVNG